MVQGGPRFNRNPQVEFFGKKYFVPPQRSATVAVDVDGDGIPDYIVSGADRDGDGIPDALQVFILLCCPYRSLSLVVHCFAPMLLSSLFVKTNCSLWIGDFFWCSAE